MLTEKNVPFTYREYTKEPLSVDEIKDLLHKLNASVFDILRSRDAKSLGLTMEESEEEVIALMAQHPKLMQRPIGVVGNRAVVGRPYDALLSLL